METAGCGLTIISTSSKDGVHGAFEIVQRNVYVPGPPAGVKVAVGLVVLLNCVVLVFGPLTIVHAPDDPAPGVFAANAVETVL